MSTPYVTEHLKQSPDLFALVMWRVAQLRVGQQRKQHAKIHMAEGFRLVGEIEKVADDDIDEHAEVIGIEIFVSGSGGK